MATTPPVGSSGSSGSTNTSSGSLKGLDTDQFFKLMISELQNQDPLNPMDNAELLQQVSQIRSVEATDKLSKTLDAVLLGQNLNSAAGMIGKQIKGLDDSAKQVSGQVSSVSVTGGVAKLHVGDQTLSLTNVSEILP